MSNATMYATPRISPLGLTPEPKSWETTVTTGVKNTAVMTRKEDIITIVMMPPVSQMIVAVTLKRANAVSGTLTILSP